MRRNAAAKEKERVMAQAQNTLEAITSGKFLTIQWVRRSGEVRTEYVRFGVKKYQHLSAPRHDEMKYLVVWCREPGGKLYNKPRLVRRDAILNIRAEGYIVGVNPRSAYAKLIQA